MALIHLLSWIIVALILLVVAFFLFGNPVTARLRKILRGKGHSSSSSPRTIVSSHSTPPQRGSRMSPRRQDSQETLLDELVDIGDDKLNAIPLDPFLVVQPSLNDSLLVKQGLVEETTLPRPTHSAYDIQESPSPIGRNPRRASILGDAPVFSWKEGGMGRNARIRDLCETEGGRDGVPAPPAAHTSYSLGQGRRGR